MEIRGRIESINGDLAIRIPEAAAETLGFSAGREVWLTVQKARFRLVVTKTRQHRYTLEELLSRVTDENRHPEVDWGPPVGNEFW